MAPPQEIPEVLDRLGGRGFERGGTWVNVMRRVGDTPDCATDLRIEMAAKRSWH